MALETLINEQIKTAMRRKDNVTLEALRSIKSALLLLKTDKKDKAIRLEDEIKLIQKQAKQRKDSMAVYQQQGRSDLADVENAQLKVIEQFLPKQLSEEEVTKIVKSIISEQGATSIKDMGKVMSKANTQLLGKADGKLISSIVKKLLC